MYSFCLKDHRLLMLSSGKDKASSEHLGHKRGKGELLYSNAFHDFMKDLSNDAPYGVSVASMDDQPQSYPEADFIWRYFSSPKAEVYVLWAREQDMWSGDFARRVQTLTTTIRKISSRTMIYMLLTRTRATAEIYSERQLELLANGLSFHQEIVPVADEFEVVDCLKRIVEKDTMIPEQAKNGGGKRKNKKASSPPRKQVKCKGSYDDRAAGALRGALSGLGDKSSRRLLAECGSLTAIAQAEVQSLYQYGFTRAISSTVQEFMDKRL